MPVNCSTCMYWFQRATWERFGDCRRHAPLGRLLVMLANDYNGDRVSLPVWPHTDQVDYCGDHVVKIDTTEE